MIMPFNPLLERLSLGVPWQTLDPFLFCVFHDDAYPAGNEAQGPAASLAGRNLGQDFEGKDGWRMYHGDVVPGFPQHPHRGFETVTIVRRGFIDHSDSLGATARFGGGDVQWLTAGSGVVHAEMFPLREQTAPNPLELFQLWLNLPAERKMAEPHFSMLWNERIPRVSLQDEEGRAVSIDVVAGRLGDVAALPPPPASWASEPAAELAIWMLKLAPGARYTLPAASAGLNRALYFFRGSSLTVGGFTLAAQSGARVLSELALRLHNGADEGELLLLQGRPLGEPVAQYGPFVMNTRAELQQAFDDYQRTRFGGWPWGSDGPVHPREQGRFAKRPDGSVETP